ncbi:hypothetical protein L3Q82_020956 [Scortum barcoo]|uniref:Uncharacterized protein n=1 Tax=Scortum barcoo TaxID=214431 RepID=A0ACB8V936_9TELE|nr:hypothetical protein L3Q82_020956 [Scortum barcoo]
MVKRQPPNKRRVKQWSEEASDALRDCFDTTDWEVLCGPHKQDIDSLTDCITDYINFCVETTVPTKREGFPVGRQRDELRRVQRDLKRKTKECKASYRRKMEDHLQQNNAREVWRGSPSYLRTGSLCLHAPSPPSTPPPSLGLSPSPPPSPPSLQCSSPPPPPSPNLFFTPTVDQVRTQLKKIKARKATGPDVIISSRLLRDCADQLCQVVCYIFNLSLSLERVPVLWKTSCVVPVPKTSRPKEPNHFRPVALTSHLMKALERIVLRHLRPLVSPNMDPLQFAYQPGIGVDDAVIYLPAAEIPVSPGGRWKHCEDYLF